MSFIDVDFPADPHFTFGDLGKRAFEEGVSRSYYADVQEIIPESRWKDEAAAIQAAGGGCSQLVSRIYNQGNEGSCFPPGTMVRMADGTQKAIEDIRLTDQVVTAEGNVGTVVHCFVRKAKGLKLLRLRGHAILHATEEHPILTQRGYVPIGELTRADSVAMPKYAATTGSGRKSIHPALLAGPDEFKTAMLEGWLDGDGAWRHKSGREGTTISKKMALNMFDIANVNGWKPYVRSKDAKPSHGVKTRQRVYFTGFGHKDAAVSLGFQAEQDDRVMWRPVWAVEDVEYDGWVYDIEVEGDHSYIADGIGVHNCVANACAQAHEIIQAKQSGKENVIPLSAISLYKRIGSSAQSGAMVSDGLDEMASRGILPLDTPENRAQFGLACMPATGFRTKYPENWEATAKQFTADEWFIVDNVAELITALLNQHPVVVGRSGHSICYCDPVYKDGSLLVKYANSWGNWGESGFGYDSLRMIRSSASWAFALRSVTFRGDQ